MNADLKAWHKLQVFELTRQAIVETNPRRKAWLFRLAAKHLDKVS
jgi:hypothetical protein